MAGIPPAAVGFDHFCQPVDPYAVVTVDRHENAVSRCRAQQIERFSNRAMRLGGSVSDQRPDRCHALLLDVGIGFGVACHQSARSALRSTFR